MNKLEAMSLSRLWQHLQSCSIATISAYRSYQRRAFTEFRLELLDQVAKLDYYDFDEIDGVDKYRISPKENQARHKMLGVDLLALSKKCNKQIGFKSIIGKYQEAGMSKPSIEKSYIVWAHPDYENKLYDEITKLATKYEQDSITFQEFGGNFKEIWTSPRDINLYNLPLGYEKSNWRNISFSNYDYELNTDEKSGLQYVKESLAIFKSEINGKPFKWDNWGKEDWDSLPADIEIRANKMVCYGKGDGSIASQRHRHTTMEFGKRIKTMLNDGKLVIPDALVDTNFGLQGGVIESNKWVSYLKDNDEFAIRELVNSFLKHPSMY